MPARLWIYNYDFELELAQQPPIRVVVEEKSPWYFLNRAASLLIPLTGSGDIILTCQTPDNLLLKELDKKLGFLPRFHEIKAHSQESNAMLANLTWKEQTLSEYRDYQLSPWGWSPLAIDLAASKLANRFPKDFKKIITNASSKGTSAKIRNNRLPESFHIPSCLITDQNISQEKLKDEMIDFISRFSRCKIKHFHGTSGRLSITATSREITPKRLKQWQTWIKTSGGILMEKSLVREQEYSIQADINGPDQIKLIAMTEQFTNKNGSYLGNLLRGLDAEFVASWSEQLLPVFSDLSAAGYIGPVGVDLLRTPGQEMKLVEINARLTMGRIAFEWDQAVNRHQIGLFTNFFHTHEEPLQPEKFLEQCKQIERSYGCSISVINFIPSVNTKRSLVTLLIGAETRQQVQAVLGIINPFYINKL